MKIDLHYLALETTRKCNLKCTHCMRGQSQNINMSDEIVDRLIDTDVGRIDTLLFSGGEPTLNPNLIINTIDKIVDGKIDVNKIAMVTNGQIFNKDIVESFNKYNIYQNKVMKNRIIKKFHFDKELIKDIIRSNTNNHARISFSIDRFHNPVSQEVKDLYKKNAKGLIITDHYTKDEDIIHTGYSTIGSDYIYEQEPFKYYRQEDNYSTFCITYITANGFVTNNGMGQYTDMDQNNYGHISEISFAKLLEKYGTPMKGTEKINLEEKPKVKALTNC